MNDSKSTFEATAGGKIALGILLALHLVAVFMLVPPGELLRAEPVWGADHPAHAYRVWYYRQAVWAGELPWGYDPAVGAGTPMRPTQDAGAKPQQFLGVVLPFLSEGQVIRGFVFLTALLAPLWLIVAARRLGLEWAAVAWSVLMLLSGLWLYQNFTGFLRWGLAAFAFAALLAPLVLVEFLGFVEKPSWRRYVTATLLLTAQAMLHVLGPVLVAPVMLWQAAFSRNLTWRWRLAALAAPLVVAAVNSFWLVPFVVDFTAPKQGISDRSTYPPDLIYESLDHMLDMLSLERIVLAIVGLVALGFGTVMMARLTGRRIAVAFAVCALLGVFLKFFGSFIPVVVSMQPARFLFSAMVLLALPTGIALLRLTKLVRVNQEVAVLGMAAVLIAAAAFKDWKAGRSTEAAPRTHVNFAGQVIGEGTPTLGLPRPLPQADLVAPLTSFVLDRTAPHERLLVQTKVQCEPKLFSARWGRDVVGNCYPDRFDSANFVSNSLFGHKLAEWTSPELKQALNRWGIAWVFTCTPKAKALLQETYGTAGEEVGIYTAFATGASSSRMLMGRGNVEASINRLQLTELEPERGVIVLRYRYHPAWRAPRGVSIEPYPIPEDPGGFMLLRNCSDNLTLQFDARNSFHATWPNKLLATQKAKP